MADAAAAGAFGAAEPNSRAPAIRCKASLVLALGGVVIGAGPNQRQPQYARTRASNASAASSAAPARSRQERGNGGGVDVVTYNFR